VQPAYPLTSGRWGHHVAICSQHYPCSWGGCAYSDATYPNLRDSSQADHFVTGPHGPALVLPHGPLPATELLGTSARECGPARAGLSPLMLWLVISEYLPLSLSARDFAARQEPGVGSKAATRGWSHRLMVRCV